MTEKRYLDLDPHARILLGPGPGMAAPRVVRAMATPPVGHLDPDLLAIYAEEQEEHNDEYAKALLAPNVDKIAHMG